MKIVYINKDGYLFSPEFQECDIEIEVSDELYEKLSRCKIGYNWKYDFNLKTFSQVLLTNDNNLKNLRETLCFRLIDNRSQMWYNRLTEQQKQELNDWYQAWLDVTETKIIPIKPEWLK